MRVRALIIVVVFISSVAFAQDKKQKEIDSLTARLAVEKNDTNKVITLNILSDKTYRAQQKDKAMQYGVDALDLSGKLNYKAGEAAAFKNIGVVYYSKLKYADALHNYKLGLNIVTQLKDTIQIAGFYTRIGLTYFRQANLPEALQADLTSLQLREEIKDSAELATSYINLGNVYSLKGNYPEAIKYERKALVLSIRFKHKMNIAACYNNIGGIEVKTKQYDSALADFKRSIQLEQQIDDQEGVAISLSNIGEIYYDLGKYNEAIDYFTQSLNLKKKVGYNRGLESVYIHFSDVYNRMKQYEKARKYADTVLMLSKQSGSKDYLESGYESMALADSGLGNYKAALANYQLARQWHDSMINDENTKKTVQAEMNYEFEKKQDAERAEQEKLNLQQELQSRKQQITIYFISGILLLVVVFAVFVVRSLRLNRRKTVIISRQKEEVERQNEEIEKQKAIVEEKNKDITDSIKYASRIQRALLTSDDYIKKRLKEYFILFKPRDIVSGDFYWANETENGHMLICAGDCTGHGVPGAFMSLLNISMLNEATLEKKIFSPEKILDEVKKHIINALNPEKSDSESKDGMDCTLCALDVKNMVMHAACANNTIWVIPQAVNGQPQVVEIAPDKMPVGIQHGAQKPFTLHTVNLTAGDSVYMFTDGYADQFGGEKGKKFKYKQLQEKLLAISNMPMAAQKNMLEQTFEDWKGGLEQVDDVLVIGIRV